MKNIILHFLLAFIIAPSFAQSVFEGKVTHKLTAETESKSGMIEIYYGKKMIKGIIKQNDDKETGKDDILLDFNKGLVYHLNAVDKTYRLDSMKGRPSGVMSALNPWKEKDRVISGYHTSAYIPKDTAEMNLFGNMTMLFWYADSLLFPVDDQLMGSDEIALFTNGKTIGMGLNMSMEFGESKKIFELAPVSIEPGILPVSTFEIPADFAFVYDTPVIPDSLREEDAFMTDSVTTTPAPPVKKTIKKKTPPKPNKSKQTVKSNPARIKE